jgi:hypothetical protein
VDRCIFGEYFEVGFSVDSQGSFPDCNYVGSRVLQDGVSSILAKNNDILPRQETCTDNSGYSKGEEDMDVDMEGGREIGMAERPALRPISQPAHVIVNNASHHLFHQVNILSHCDSLIPPRSELIIAFGIESTILQRSSVWVICY